MNSEEKTAKEQVIHFTLCFINYLSKKESEYYNQAVGIESKNYNISKYCSPVQASLKGVSKIKGEPIISTAVAVTAGILDVLKEGGNFYLKSKHKDKAVKISNVLKTTSELDMLTDTLIETAINIYIQYQDIFLSLPTDINANIILHRLAIDAVQRILKFIQNFKENEQILDVEFFLKAFHNGSSIDELEQNIVGKFKEIKKENWTFSFLNKTRGIVQFENEEQVCYRKKKTKNKVDEYINIPDFNISKNKYEKVDESRHVFKIINENFIESLKEEITDKLSNEKIDEKILENTTFIKSAIENQAIIQETTKNDILEAIENSNAKEHIFPVTFNLQKPVSNFVGRKFLLEEIHTKLLENSNDNFEITRAVCLTGSGGFGKTELARKYADVNFDFFKENIVWFNAETIEELEVLFKNLAAYLKIHRSGSECIENIIKQVYKCFNNETCLFIFDNAEALSDLRKFLPCAKYMRKNKSFTILTSTNQNWNVEDDGKIEIINVDTFTDEEAVEFVNSNLKLDQKDNLTNESVLALIKTVQNHPLALKQAIAFINKENEECLLLSNKNFTISNYLKIYELEILNQIKNTRYNKNIFTTWNVTISKLKQSENGQKAIKILKLISFMPPDDIDCSQFEDKKSMLLLHSYSLVKLKKGFASMHRLTQEMTRYELEKNYEYIKYLFEVLLIIPEYAFYCYNFVRSNKKLSESFKNKYLTIHFHHEPIVEACLAGDLEKIKELMIDNTNKIYSCGKRLIHFAAMASYLDRENNYLEILKLLIKNNADVNAVDTDGNTILHYATQNNHLQMCLYLLQNGAVDKENNLGKKAVLLATESNNLELVKTFFEYGTTNSYQEYSNRDTLLHIALNNNNSKIINFLFEKQEAIDLPNSCGQTPLILASKNGNLEMVTKLLKTKAININHVDISGKNALYYALDNGHLSIVELLMENNAHIDVVWEKTRETQLGIACKEYNVTVATFYLNNKANVNHQDNEGYTPLHCVSNDMIDNLVLLLIKNNADVNIKTNDGFTPLHIAAYNNNLNILEALIENKAKIDEKDNAGNTSLYWAVHGNNSCAITLLQNGADVNTMNINNNTPLYTVKSIDMAKLLLDNGANIHHVDNDGDTPLHQAILENFPTLAQFLIENGADIEVKNKKGRTPLLLAANLGYLFVVKVLVENKADVFQQDDKGRTAVQLALKHQHSDVVKYLLENGATDVNCENK